MKYRSSLSATALSVVALGVAAAACSSEDGGDPVQHEEPVGDRCEADDRAEDYSANMEKGGAVGEIMIKLVESRPVTQSDAGPIVGPIGPPARYDNIWTLNITDADGNAIEDADVRVKTWMPDHGHESNRKSVVRWVEGAEYEVNPLNLMMPGFWEITVSVDDTEAGISDSVLFSFCIAG